MDNPQEDMYGENIPTDRFPRPTLRKYYSPFASPQLDTGYLYNTKL